MVTAAQPPGASQEPTPHGEEVENAPGEAEAAPGQPGLLGTPGGGGGPAGSYATEVAPQLPRTLLGLLWAYALSSSHFERRGN